jgi:phage shock protein C
MKRHRRKFYLDKEHAKVSGVCAGIADYFDWDVTIVRVAWVAGTIFSGVWPLVVAYVLMAWLVDPKPLGLTYREDTRYAEARAEIDGARSEAYRPARTWRFSDVKNRFSRVEDRLRTLEQVVTSREFQMDRELRGVGRV